MRTEKFKNIFWFAPKSNIKAGEGLEKGRFPFYTSSQELSKRLDREQYFDEALIFGTGGKASVHYADEPFSTSTDCIVAITNKKNISTKYVFYYLHGNIHLLERGFKGAGLRHISKTFIENLTIPIFPIELQNKIVTVLDKATTIYIKKENALKLYNNLLASIFNEFFGDPVVNPKQWKKQELSYFGEIITGNTPPRKNSEFYSEPFIEWIKTNNIIEDKIHPTQANEYLSELGSRKGRMVENGAVLVACIAGSLSSIGRASMVDRQVAFNQQINAIQPNNSVSSYFLYFLIKYSSSYIQQYATKGMKKIITKGVFQSIKFIVPPYDLQIKFENIVLQIINLKNKLDYSYSDISLLSNSITQKVFNGELGFNIDIELDSLIKGIDLEKKDNDLSVIANDFAYLQRLIDKLNYNEFADRELYDKAKYIVFQLLKEDTKIIQVYNESSKSISIALK